MMLYLLEGTLPWIGEVEKFPEGTPQKTIEDAVYFMKVDMKESQSLRMNKLIRLIKKLESLGFSEEPHYQEYI